MSGSNIDIETLLKNIYDNKIKIETDKNEIAKNLAQIQDLREKLENDYSDARYKAEKLIIDAKNEARDILLNAKDDVTNTIKSAKKIYSNFDENSIKNLNNLRNNLNAHIKKNLASNSNDKNINSGLSLDDVTLGMKVFVCNLSCDGTILSVPNQSSEVQVQVGAIKITSPLSNLIKSSSSNSTPRIDKKSSYYSSQKSKTISSEIMVLGMNIDDAISVIDKYLDDAKISKLETVRIVHGKGTGKLRAGVHKFLQTHPHVKNFRIGTYGEGEMGVTIVNLK